MRHQFALCWKLIPVPGSTCGLQHFPRYWPFVRGIHRPPVNSPHKDQRRGALMFSLICAWINGWVNNREAGDLRRHRAHCDVIVMNYLYGSTSMATHSGPSLALWRQCDLGLISALCIRYGMGTLYYCAFVRKIHRSPMDPPTWFNNSFVVNLNKLLNTDSQLYGDITNHDAYAYARFSVILTRALIHLFFWVTRGRSFPHNNFPLVLIWFDWDWACAVSKCQGFLVLLGGHSPRDERNLPQN